MDAKRKAEVINDDDDVDKLGNLNPNSQSGQRKKRQRKKNKKKNKKKGKLIDGIVSVPLVDVPEGNPSTPKKKKNKNKKKKKGILIDGIASVPSFKVEPLVDVPEGNASTPKKKNKNKVGKLIDGIVSVPLFKVEPLVDRPEGPTGAKRKAEVIANDDVKFDSNSQSGQTKKKKKVPVLKVEPLVDQPEVTIGAKRKVGVINDHVDQMGNLKFNSQSGRSKKKKKKKRKLNDGMASVKVEPLVDEPEVKAEVVSEALENDHKNTAHRPLQFSSRAALCGYKLSNFNSWRGGLSFKNKQVKGLLLAGHTAKGDICREHAIITHAGGKRESHSVYDVATGTRKKVYLSANDHSPLDRSVKFLTASMTNRVPIAVHARNDYEPGKKLLDLSAPFTFLGFYYVTVIWMVKEPVEQRNGLKSYFTRCRIRLDRAHGQAPLPTKSVSVSSPATKDPRSELKTKNQRHCENCDTLFHQPYKINLSCVNPKCSNFFKIQPKRKDSVARNGSVDLEDYDERFLDLDLLESIRKKLSGLHYGDGNGKEEFQFLSKLPIRCECNYVSDRRYLHWFECPRCGLTKDLFPTGFVDFDHRRRDEFCLLSGSVSYSLLSASKFKHHLPSRNSRLPPTSIKTTKAPPLCDNSKHWLHSDAMKLPAPSKNSKQLPPIKPTKKFKQPSLLQPSQPSLKRVPCTSEQAPNPVDGLQIRVFFFPNGANVVQIKPGAEYKTFADKLYVSLQSDRGIPFERLTVLNKVKNTLGNQFSYNYGLTYVHASTLNSRDIMTAPDLVKDAIRKVQAILESTFKRAKYCNQALLLAYLPGQGMKAHSDDEKGIKDPVVTCSFGGTTEFIMRVKEPISPFHWSKIPDKSILELKSTHEKCVWDDVEPLEEGTIVLKMTMEHGDIVIMNGASIQKLTTHEIGTVSDVRFALTMRKIGDEDCFAELR
ncbi:hypothetical protein HDU76_013551 [Blyttiomyces sp. JEL0837]|nr:hypothetical protein HDU76_013551 [Blyttiomyces sp. JEL0837]